MANHTDSKGKVIKMNAPATPVSTHLATAVKLSDIYADFAWNSRAERNVQDMADTESAGFDGFEANIRLSGQITPIILRNTAGKALNGKKTDKAYEVVCGFRRFRAISSLNAKGIVIPNLASGTILGEVRECKTETEARILNGQENTARKNLKAPDLVFLVRDLSKAGMAQVPISEALGITQGWVSKLLRVGSLPPAVLDHWRDNKPIPPVQTKDGIFELKAENCKVGTELTEPEMRALAEIKSGPEEITARYIRLVSPRPQGESEDGPENEDKDAKRIRETASLMGCLVRAGVLDNGSLDWNRVIGPKRKGYPIECGKDDSQDRLLFLGDMATEAFEAEVSKGARGVAK
jgi:hypothetical protein